MYVALATIHIITNVPNLLDTWEQIEWHLNKTTATSIQEGEFENAIYNRFRKRRRNLWVEWCVSSSLLLFPSGSSVLIYIYIDFLYEFCYRMYIYIQPECHSVLVRLHPIAFYRTVFLGSVQFPGWMPLFVFFGLPIVSCSLMIIVWYQDACDFWYLFYTTLGY